MSIAALLFVRFVKLLAVLAFAAGTAGAFLPRELEDRKRFAYLLAAPGLAVAWGAGLATAAGTGVSPIAPWIAGAAVASTIGINVVLWAVGREGRRSWVPATVSIASIAVAIALMVWKPVLS